MKEKRIGLYIGIKSAGAILIQANKTVSLSKFELSSLEEDRESLNTEEIQWDALVNRTLKEIGGDLDVVYLSLADRDFIFRTIELPIMRKKEIEAALVYEIEKYIPFKINELEWDYGYVRIPREKKLIISFVGIRDINIQRARDMLARLEFKIAMVEPSCLSLARSIKLLKNFSPIKNFALLDFTHAEAYLTFFQHDFPVFNRYLTVPKKESSLDLDKFIESVNFSFQYFKREFKSYKLEKFIIVGDPDIKSLVSPLEDTLQAKTEILSPYDLTNRNNAGTENIKALGAAKVGDSAYKFVLDLKKIKEDIPVEVPVGGEPLKIGLFILIIAIGLLFCIGISLYFNHDISSKKAALVDMERKLVIPKEFEGISDKEIKSILDDLKKKQKVLKQLVKVSSVKFSSVFETLSMESILPEGLWLKSLIFGTASAGQAKGVITGCVYRGDSYEEKQSIDEFVSILRDDADISALFPNIIAGNTSAIIIDEYEVTTFVVSLN